METIKLNDLLQLTREEIDVDNGYAGLMDR